MTTETHTLHIEEILELLPHRYPFLLVDRVLDFEEGRFLRAVKMFLLTSRFRGHFPGKPILPGVLILEAMAQATGILAFKASASSNRVNSITSPGLMKRVSNVR